MSDDIHPVPGIGHGTVPEVSPPAHRTRHRAGRARRVAAGVAIGLALAGGAVAISQAPLHDSRVGSVFTATQNPDDGTAEQPAPAERSHPGTSRTHEDDEGHDD